MDALADELARADAGIATVGMTARADDTWPTPLSQGERGRSLIARALISAPELLLLDEPTTGLDVAAREQLLETVDSMGDAHPEMASILVTHHLEELPTSTTRAADRQRPHRWPAARRRHRHHRKRDRGIDHPIDVAHRRPLGRPHQGHPHRGLTTASERPRLYTTHGASPYKHGRSWGWWDYRGEQLVCVEAAVVAGDMPHPL